MSDLEKLLRDMAHDYLTSVEQDGSLEAQLVRRLLPILEAGQAMRDHWLFGAAAYQGKDSREAYAWDAEKEKAKGKP